MRQVLGIAVIILTLMSGGILVSAADRSTDQKPEKGQASDSSKGKKKGKQETKGVGPHGEAEQGGAGPSGPAPLPPGDAPGFEGANKDKSKSPSAGGK